MTGPREIGTMAVRLAHDVERAQGALSHLLLLLRLRVAIVTLGGPLEPRLALPRSRLLHCIVCDCVLDNPADWPASAGYYRCAWCTAVHGWTVESRHEAAQFVWGARALACLIEDAEVGEQTVWPPSGVCRRPVSAPTTRCYR